MRCFQMKKIIKENISYLMVSFVIVIFIFLVGCSGVTPISPIIHFFSANTLILTEGESTTISWIVSDATTVTINYGIGIVALSGSTSVSPTTTTTYTLTATNSAGSSTATVTITVNPAIIEQTLTIQPGPTEGKDSAVTSDAPDSNYGTSEYFAIGNTVGPSIARAYLQFDLSALPTSAIIVSANLKLYQFITFGTEDFIIELHQVTVYWDEDTITWNNQSGYLPALEGTSPVVVDAITWLSWDISSLLQDWLDGSIDNHGIVLKDTDEALGDTYIWCRSSNYTADPALRPKIEITYYVP